MRINTQCEEYVRRPELKVGFDAAGEFSDCYNGEVLDWSLKTTGTDDKTTRTEKTAVLTRRYKSKKLSTERITRTCSTDPRETRSGRELRHETTLLECASMQNDVEGSYTSACVT